MILHSCKYHVSLRDLAFEQHGNLLHKDLALAWVRALFARRDAKIVTQKIERGELPSSKRDEAVEALEDAIEEEEEAEEAYQKACQASQAAIAAGGSVAAAAAGSSSSGAAAAAASSESSEHKEQTESKSSEANPYGQVSRRNIVTEDLF